MISFTRQWNMNNWFLWQFVSLEGFYYFLHQLIQIMIIWWHWFRSLRIHLKIFFQSSNLKKLFYICSHRRVLEHLSCTSAAMKRMWWWWVTWTAAFWLPLKEGIAHLDMDKKVQQTIRATVHTPSPKWAIPKYTDHFSRKGWPEWVSDKITYWAGLGS